jgi:3,4-dihydroxy 2-butanone 4-phosphate synthase/GTP cyclohydrolase II
LQIVERIPVHVEPNEENVRYLRTKRDRLGHLMEGGGL